MGETYQKALHPLKAAAVSAITRASPGTITIPAGHSGRLRQVAFIAWPTVETVVNAGGLVELENDAIKGMQFSCVVGGSTAVTEGGAHQNEPQVYKVDIPIVGPSTYTVYYTPYDDQSQSLSTLLIWERGGAPNPSRPNYVKANNVLKASAVTAITKAVSHNTISIPSGKGGTLLGVEILVWPTLETVVNAGGLVELISSVDDWKPFDFIAGGATSVGASGGVQLKPNVFPVNKKLTGNSSVTSDYTPYDNQSQSLGLTLLWRGPEPR